MRVRCSSGVLHQSQHPQGAATAFLDFQRRAQNHRASGRQSVQIGQALQAIAARTMHVVVARVGWAQVIALARIGANRLGTKTQDIALIDQEPHRLGAGAGGVLAGFVKILIGLGVAALRPIGAHQQPSTGGDAAMLGFKCQQIIHGQQYVSDDLRRRPTTYFTPASGVGLAMLAKAEKGPLHVGVLGLGVGTLVAYGRAGDVYRLYEIDPLVIELAQEKFTYLSDTPAKLEIVLGDGRLQLEREPSQQFDVLVMDAFSGDSVPVHLLTLEAFAIYFKHLKTDGVLAMNVTNAFLDLVPVLKRAADHYGKHIRLLEHPGDQDLAFASRWVLITGNKDFFDQTSLQAMREVDAPKDFVAWRDDYSSLLAVLKKKP